MNYSRDIITLQVGHFSNFIGSHWWNLQEGSFIYDKNQSTDINHDFLFRESISSTKQEIYTPRLLIIDKKGSLGSLPLLGNLHETKAAVQDLTTNQASWNGEVEVVHQLKEEKNEYLQFLEDEESKCLDGFDEDKDVCLDTTLDTTLDMDKNSESQNSFNLSDKVNVWSDYLRPYLHPETIYCLKDACHYEDQRGSSGFQAGEEIMRKEEPLDETINRIRLLAESCSSLQGFQLLSDGYNEMGGVSLAIAQHLEDDYKSKDLFSFVSSLPHYKPSTTQDLVLYITSLVQSYTELSKLSSMVIPLNITNKFWEKNSDAVNFPHSFYQKENAYESSSLLACFLETMTVPYRSKSLPLPMSHFSHLVTPLQKKIAGGSLALPLGLNDNSSLSSMLIKNQDFSYCSVSGNMDFNLNPISEHRVLRGIPASMLKHDGFRSRNNYNNSWTMYKDFLEERSSRTPPFVSGICDAIKITPPFPQIFSPTVTEYGFLKTKSPFDKCTIKSTPAAAMVSQCNGVGAFLSELLENVKRIDVSKVPRLIEEDLDKERWNDVLEDLRNNVQQYNLDQLDLDDSDSH